jgi:hypothetical protein
MAYTLTFRSKVPLDRSDALPRGASAFFVPAPFMDDEVMPISFFAPSVFRQDPVHAAQSGLCILERATKAFEDQRNPFWRSATGPPVRWMVHNGRQIRLIPASAATVIVGYLEAPAALVNDTDTPDARIPVPHHAYLKFAAAAWLLRQDGDQRDDARAQELMQTFNALIGAGNG